MKAHWSVRAVSHRGGRAVYLLVSRNDELVRIYKRGHHWRYYDLAEGDRPVSDRAMLAAVRRAGAAEAEARHTLFPEAARRVRRRPKAGAAGPTTPAP